ncbi:hypothetical protein BV22DRAFT_44217 [Leucogyrophana mollusca]|uniref:Uncharacterized protein n=1 Tax=Leucogyrophana mollusca TaxID=85980 RepID=A0ACB8C117_9AGAM|nr:hypothetical protein BV22DRAFT_44217 [Leucogyrophana mollusca]
MATPVTEVLTLTSNELMSTSDNPRECAEIIKNFSGFQRLFWGNRVQEPGVYQWFIDWDERPKQADPEASKTVEEKLREVVSQPPERKLVAFKTFPHTHCFTAPITEVIYATAKPDTDLEEFKKVVDVSLQATEVFKGCYGTSWGYVLDTEREVMMVVGWESIEDHVSFTKTEEFRVTTDPFLELVSKSGFYYMKAHSS